MNDARILTSTISDAGASNSTVARGLATKSSRTRRPSRCRDGSHGWMASALRCSRLYRWTRPSRVPTVPASASSRSWTSWPGGRKRTRSSGTKQVRVTPSTSSVTRKCRSTSQYCRVRARVRLWFVMTLVVTRSVSLVVASRIAVRWARRRAEDSRATELWSCSAAREVNVRAPSSELVVEPLLLELPRPPEAPTPPTMAPIAPPRMPPMPPATPQLDEEASFS